MVFTQKTPTTGAGLRAGPSGVSRGAVTEIQRGRILAAAVQVVEEVGYARTTVAQVITRARVSRKTFYLVFRDREDCFLAAFNLAIDGATGAAVEGLKASSIGARESAAASLACSRSSTTRPAWRRCAWWRPLGPVRASSSVGRKCSSSLWAWSMRGARSRAERHRR